MTRHIFLSYVRENASMVDRLAADLRALGVPVWLDRERIMPGQRWRDAIREAIRAGGLFVACFSREYLIRDSSYMNEELTIGIEELRLRPTDRTWFIPASLDGANIPPRSIGAGETLTDLQWVDLSSQWEQRVNIIAGLAGAPASTTGGAPTVFIDQNGQARSFDADAVDEILLTQASPPFYVDVHKDALFVLISSPHAFATGEDSHLLYDAIRSSRDFYRQIASLDTSSPPVKDRHLRVVFLRAKAAVDAVDWQVTFGLNTVLFTYEAQSWFLDSAERASCISAYIERLFRTRSNDLCALKLDIWLESRPFWHFGIALTESEETEVLRYLDYSRRSFLAAPLNVRQLPRHVITTKFFPALLVEACPIQAGSSESKDLREALLANGWRFGLG